MTPDFFWGDAALCYVLAFDHLCSPLMFTCLLWDAPAMRTVLIKVPKSHEILMFVGLKKDDKQCCCVIKNLIVTRTMSI